MTETVPSAARPLVSFALFAYNQERFIREAVEGALSQDYSPLQIILSDDSSSDRTFEIMREMTEVYEGPHEILLNRNEENLGIGGHIRRVVGISTGEIVVLAAGDDISHNTRVSNVESWFAENPCSYAVFSNVEVINEGGGPVTELVFPSYNLEALGPESLARRGGGIWVGAAYAYRRESFFWPWQFPQQIVSEDRLLPYRAAILGGVGHLNESLVQYRKTNGSLSRELKFVPARFCDEHIQELRDTTVRAVRDTCISQVEFSRIMKTLESAKTWHRMLARLEDASSLVGRLIFKILSTYYYRDTLLAKLRVVGHSCRGVFPVTSNQFGKLGGAE